MWHIDDDLSVMIGAACIRGVTVNRGDKGAFDELLSVSRRWHTCSGGKSFCEIEEVQHARRLFLSIGIDPTKHRPSSEALLRRALKEKEFYSINAVVDIGNWCSLEFLLPACVYDLDEINGDIHVRMGRFSEAYEALNKREARLEGKLVLCDDKGPFGSPTTDSKRSAVTEFTKNVLCAFYAPGGYSAEELYSRIETFAGRVRRFCGGSIVSVEVVEGRPQRRED